MNKSELIEQVAQQTELSKAKAAEAVDAFIKVVGETLKKGEDVAILGFGTFSVAEREAREGRHPRTGEPMKIAACRQPKFKAGKGLKDMVK